MKIEKIIKETQPERYSELRPKKKEHSKQQLTEKDINELMGHSSYKRCKGGAIRQVR